MKVLKPNMLNKVRSERLSTSTQLVIGYQDIYNEEVIWYGMELWSISKSAPYGPSSIHQRRARNLVSTA